MTRYEYFMEMKDIAERKGREHPDISGFWSKVAVHYESKAKSLTIEEGSMDITEEDAERLELHRQ